MNLLGRNIVRFSLPLEENALLKEIENTILLLFLSNFLSFLRKILHFPKNLSKVAFALFLFFMPKTVTSEELLAHAAHLGHKTSRWNPKMKPFLYGSKEGVHLFDLEQTAAALNSALDILKRAASEGKVILFCSTKPQTAALLKRVKEETGMPVVTQRWFGGLLTNFPTIKERILRFKSLREQERTGELDRYPKKEKGEMLKEAAKLEIALGGVADLRRVPDILFVVDGNRDEIAIAEAKKCKVKVIGIADTNANPDLYDLAIPANDDSLKSLDFILGAVIDAIKEGKKGGKKEEVAE